MAQEEVTLEVKIQAAEAANTIKDLNKSLKVLRDEIAKVPQGSAEFKKLASAINEAEGKIGDITDSFSTLTGSGVERTEKSLGLLREGFTKLDTGKIGLGFKALGSAMSAIPVFLLLEAFNYLRENFDELSKGTGILAKALRGVGEIIDWLKKGLDLLGVAVELAVGFFTKGFDGIRDSYQRLKKEKFVEYLGKELTEAVKESTEALKLQTAEYDRQITVAKAAGKSTVELEKEKQQAIIDTNKALVEQTIAYVRAGGVLDEERKKNLTEQLEAIKNARVQQRVIDETFEKEQKDKAQKALEDKKKLLEAETQKRLEELEKQRKYEEELNNQRKKWDKELSDQILSNLNKTLKASNEAIAENIDKEFLAAENKRAFRDAQTVEEKGKYEQMLADNVAQRDLALQNEMLTQQERIKIINEADQKERDIKKQRFDDNVNLTAQSLGAAQKLTDMFFAGQLKAAKGNADKEREIKKKQFNINKAFGITNAVIDGVRSVQAALTQTPPLSYVLAALNAALAVANVAQIASAKFDDTGGSSGGSGGGEIAMGSVGASAPTITQPNNTVTKLDENGEINKAKAEQPVVKAVVVETDVTDSQKRVNSIKESATF